jgi:hypothetical protein
LTTRFLGLKLVGMEIRIEPRGMIEVWNWDWRRERLRCRLVPGYAIVVDGREWNPYFRRRAAEKIVRAMRTGHGTTEV